LIWRMTSAPEGLIVKVLELGQVSILQEV